MGPIRQPSADSTDYCHWNHYPQETPEIDEDVILIVRRSIVNRIWNIGAEKDRTIQIETYGWPFLECEGLLREAAQTLREPPAVRSAV